MSANKLKEIFFEAIQADPAERLTLISELCAGDQELELQVARLVEAHEQSNDLLTEPWIHFDEDDSEWVDHVPPEIGGRRILAKLGQGGCGVVYLAQQEKPIEAKVAIKVILPGTASPTALKRFDVEQHALAVMQHPSIATVLDVGRTDDGLPFIVMEYVDGVRITEYAELNQLSVRQRVELFQQVCMAVQHAHEKGIVHRDIKPSNVLVAEIDGKPIPKIIDFGIAKAVRGELAERTALTMMDQIVGTPQYMAPEQIAFDARHVDTRTDVYALGTLLYELLSGKTPFSPSELRGAGPAELERIIRHEEPTKPSSRVLQIDSTSREMGKRSKELRGDLDWIIGKAMEKDRARRYHGAAALAKDLGRHLDGRPVEAGPPSGFYRLGKVLRRNRLQFTAGLIVFLALIAVALVSISAASEAKREQAETQRQLEKFESIVEFTEEMFAGLDPKIARGGDTSVLRKMLEKAIRRIEANPPSEIEVEIQLRTLIGLALNSILRYEEAREQLAKAVELGEKTKSYDMIRSRAESGLAQVLVALGQYDEAARRFGTVSRERRRILGDRDPLTLQSMSNYAVSLTKLRRDEEALALNREVFRLRRDVLGKEHRDTMATQNNLAMNLCGLDQDEEAVPLLEEVLRWQVKTQTLKHPQTLATMNNLASAYSEVGRTAEAVRIFEQAIDVKTKILQKNDPSIAASRNNLATILGQNGEPAKAIEILTKAIRDISRKGAKPGVAQLTLMNNLATNLAKVDRKEEALQVAKQTVVGLKGLLRPSHPNVIVCELQVCILTVELGNHGEALKLIDDLVPRVRHLREGHSSTPQIYLTRARALAGLKREEEAEKQFLDGFELAEKTYAPRSDALQRYINAICKFYEASGQTKLAQEWRNKMDHD